MQKCSLAEFTSLIQEKFTTGVSEKLIEQMVATRFESPKGLKLANLEDIFNNLTGHSQKKE